MTVLPRVDRVRAAFAAFLAIVLIAAATLAGAIPAQAAGASATAVVSSAATTGLTVQINAAGLEAATGAYVAIIPRGGEGAVTTDSTQWVRNIADGAFTTALVAPAAKLDRAVSYEVLVWEQHTNPDAATIIARADIAVSSTQWDAVFPPVTPEPEPEPTTPTEPEPTTPAEPVPAVAVSVTDASATAGATVRVVGSQFAGITGAYAAVIEKGTEAAFDMSGGYVVFGYWMTPGAIAAGAFDKTLVAPNAKLEASKQYEVLVWEGHTAPNADTIYARGDVVFSDAQRAVLFPVPAPAPKVVVSKTTGVDPAGETVTVTGSGFLPNAPATSGTRDPLLNKFTGVYVTFGSFLEAWQPSAEVAGSARKGLDTKWAVLAEDVAAVGGAARGAITLDADGSFSTTLTLTKKDADALANGKWGVYTYPGGGAKYAPFEIYTPVTFAAPAPKPTIAVSVTDVSATAGATVRVVGSQFTGITGAYAAVIEKGTEASLDENGGYVVFGYWMTPGAIAAGAFDKTLVAPNAKLDASKQYEVIVWEGHTAPDADTIYARGDVVFSDAQRAVLFPQTEPKPTIAVSVTDASATAGATVRVVGTQFTGITGAYAAVIEKGTEASLDANGGYVAFGFWMTPGAIVGGAFDKNLVAPNAKLDASKQYEVIVWEGHTAPNADTIYARGAVVFSDAQRAVLFPSTEPKPTPSPSTPTTPTLKDGSLRWGISAPFANYVTGSIAKGSISVSNGATRAGGVFQFGQATGSSYDPKTGLGAVSYAGSVRYLGHGGLLDVSFSDPQLRITTPGSAALYVTHGGTRVHLANVALSAGTTTRSGNTVTVTGAPTTLAAAGVGIFQGNYAAGSSLEPLTVVIGAPAAAPAGNTGTIASAPAPASLAVFPATPPATEGIVLTDEEREALLAGSEVTLSASGFGAGERDIAAVVYSTPTVIARNLVADADGVVSWTGTMPATLADGTHTFTFQGSVSRGVVFELKRSSSVALGSCEVTGATLSWGFLTSFRNYIEGIAAGGWELAGVTYEYPNYVWANGTGTFDAEAGTGLVSYGGSIRFTGHSGALDTTLLNARIELAGDVGYVVVDVTGTTQAGEAINLKDVRFAQFSVPSDAFDADTAVLTLSEVSTTLTAEGASAFGTYPEGEALDPLSATISVDPSCLIVEEAPEEPAVAVGPDNTASEGADVAPAWPWVAGGLAVVLIAAAAWFVVARRRKAEVAETHVTE